jgi:hypothetical protein
VGFARAVHFIHGPERRGEPSGKAATQALKLIPARVALCGGKCGVTLQLRTPARELLVARSLRSGDTCGGECIERSVQSESGGARGRLSRCACSAYRPGCSRRSVSHRNGLGQFGGLVSPPPPWVGVTALGVAALLEVVKDKVFDHTRPPKVIETSACFAHPLCLALSAAQKVKRHEELLAIHNLVNFSRAQKARKYLPDLRQKARVPVQRVKKRGSCSANKQHVLRSRSRSCTHASDVNTKRALISVE